MRRSRSLAALLAAVVVVVATAGTARASAVTQANVDAAVVPLNVDAAVVPIDVQDSIQALEVQHESGARTTVTLSSDVLFAFNSSKLTATARQTIARLAGRLQSRGVKSIHVDGYTDSIGSPAYNLGLSRRRAFSVEQALRAALSGAPQIVTTGHGEADPVADNTKDGHDNPAGRAQNRRVVIGFSHG